MKYLKTYRLFEDVNVSPQFTTRKSIFDTEFIGDMKDYCLEVSDAGYNVYIYPSIYQVYTGDWDKAVRSSKIKAFDSCVIEINPTKLHDRLGAEIKNCIITISEYIKDYNYVMDIELDSGDPVDIGSKKYSIDKTDDDIRLSDNLKSSNIDFFYPIEFDKIRMIIYRIR